MQAERTGAAWQTRLDLALPARLLQGVAREWLSWRPAALALLFALSTRLPYFARSDFPINDGGLFVVMARDLLAAHFALPAFTTYNALAIPFAYPPFALYVVAGISGLTGLDAVALARWLPLLANLGTVVAVAMLARELLRPGWAMVLAPIAFGLLPRSYEWMIMGGGLTRAPGYLFAVACLLQGLRLARAPTIWRAGLCALLAALALATHLEDGLFALYSLALALACYRPGPRALFMALLVGLGAALLAAPWWATVVGRHGLAPFQAASLTSGWATPGNLLAALGEFLAPPSVPLSLAGSLALVGAALCLARREPFLPLWLAAVFLLTPRSAPSEGVLPMALLASVAVADVLVPGMLATLRQQTELLRLPQWTGQLPRLAWGLGLLVVLGGVYRFSPRLPLDSHALDTLAGGERQTMAWLASQTPPDARFLVLSSTASWEQDSAGEWFPVLTGRQSVLTPQGTEWLPDELHARKVCLWLGVRDVAVAANVAELDTWAGERGVSFSHIYVSKAERGPSNWMPLVASAEASPRYTVLLDTPEAVVLQREAPVAPRWPESGQFSIARDCQSLADQPLAVVANFEANFGQLAARAWAEQHERTLPVRPSGTSLLRQLAGLLPRPGVT